MSARPFRSPSPPSHERSFAYIRLFPADAASPLPVLRPFFETVTDKTNPKAITWLESTLPGSASAYKNDAEDLEKLRDEVRILEEGLISECERNSELQEQIIASRSRSDEMVAMMQLIRSETEAVLERYAGECVCCVRAQ